MSKLFATVIFFLAIYLVVNVAAASVANVVDTRQGRVRGFRQDIQVSRNQSKSIYKFLGVPYAKKPIDHLRFKPPRALCTRRTSVYNATFLRPICMQTGYYFDSIRGAWPAFTPDRDMSEDCLYLNIYTPSTTSATKYPVIVHIHGGSYFDGTPIRDVSPGEYLPTRDVVLVTIQYRLGAFGFFTTGDSEAPGNVGLLDQVEALKWIQQNIENFGGDKNSVTLLGESAGGSSVGLHYLSPLSNGLFHRGIAVSGVDLSFFAYKPKSVVLGTSRRLARKVNCTKQSTRETVRCLRSVTSETVNTEAAFWLMQPFVDQDFLPDEPKKLRERGRFKKLPLMSGFTSQELSFVIEQNVKNYTSISELRMFSENFFPFATGYTKDAASAAYNASVVKYRLNVGNSSKLRENVIDMFSDILIIAPTHAALTFHSDQGATAYMFEFAHRSRHHPKPQWMGVVHEDTTAYKFGLPLLNSTTPLQFDSDDKMVSKALVTMFTNFAKYDNPTPSPVRGVQWEPFGSSNSSYLKIGKNPVMKANYSSSRMQFWNTEFPSLLLPNGTSDESTSSAAVKKRRKPSIYPIVW